MSNIQRKLYWFKYLFAINENRIQKLARCLSEGQRTLKGFPWLKDRVPLFLSAALSLLKARDARSIEPQDLGVLGKNSGFSSPGFFQRLPFLGAVSEGVTSTERHLDQLDRPVPPTPCFHPAKPYKCQSEDPEWYPTSADPPFCTRAVFSLFLKLPLLNLW